MDMYNKTNRLIRKLKGYQKSNRDRFLLLSNGQLTHEELILYEFCIAITDWDKNHETYGTFEATNQEIAQILNWKSDSTVSRHRKKLVVKGYFKILGERMKTKDFENWELRKGNSAKMQKEHAEMQGRVANIQADSAKMQAFHAQNANYSLVSSRDNLGLSESNNGLSEEDIKWINENVKEEIKQEGTPY